MQPDFTTDFLNIADGAETVQLHRAGAASVSVAGAVRRRVEVAQASDLPGVTRRDAVWHLPAAAIDGDVGPGDVIEQSAGDQWTIVTAALVTLNTRWRCLARQQQLIAALTELVAIEQATWQRGRGGEQLAQWSVLHADVAAVIRPRIARRETAADQQQFIITHDVTLAEPLALDTTHRVVDAEGNTYRIVNYRPGPLPVLECVQT